MKKLLIPLLAMLLFALVIIPGMAFKPANNTITRSAVTFQIKNLGINTGGSIGGLQADIKFKPADLPSSAIQASVDVNTINTDNSLRDDHLKSDEFFDAVHYPKITMKSVSFKHKGGSNYYGMFNLTIKGKTKPVNMPFTYTEAGNTATFKGSFKINRRDFGVGDSSLTLSDEVVVIVQVDWRD